MIAEALDAMGNGNLQGSEQQSTLADTMAARSTPPSKMQLQPVEFRSSLVDSDFSDSLLLASVQPQPF